MFQSKTYEISSTDDIELGIRRYSKLEFKVSFDDTKPMKALFVFINGIRSADYAGYEEHLAEFVVQTYGVAVLRVDYHCIGFRPQTGATYYMDKKDKENFAHQVKKLEEVCRTSIGLPEDFFSDEIIGQEKSYENFNSLNNIIQVLKNQGRADPKAKLPLSISLQPTKDEYNNFGIMQALDIINAIYFVRKNSAKFKLSKTPKTLLFGTSHGGYLGFLCAKFAPWLIDAVVENSGYVVVPLHFYSVGKDIDFVQFREVEGNVSENIALCIFTKTHFTTNTNSPNFLCKARLDIRNPLNESQLKTQVKHQNKPIFVSYHSVRDGIDSAQNKEKFFEILQNSGFEASLRVVKDESEIDGKFIKNLEHGMGMSIKSLIKKELPPLLARHFPHENDEKREITYKSENLEYKFKEKARGGGIELFVRKI